MMNKLNADRIQSLLPGEAPRVHCFDVVTSTQVVLRDQLSTDHRSQVVLAEQQTQGRGRRGRQWLSPKQAGLYLSYAHITQRPVATLGPLSLVLAIAVATVLPAATRIKWPNDLVSQHRGQWVKVGGCLVETQPGQHAEHVALMGVGLNLSMGQYLESQPDQAPAQAWGDVEGIDDRNRLAAEVIGQLSADFGLFERDGFAPFAERWADLDSLKNQPVRVLFSPEEAFDGVACGINEQGQLAVQTPEGMSWVSAADVSIRPLQ